MSRQHVFDDQCNPSIPNESTRLLNDSNVDEEAVSTEQEPVPFPTARLSAVIAFHLAEPIALWQIFPYINQLLVDMHIAKPDRVGFYSGLVESAYSIAEVLSAYQWGRLSDIVGRRPVIFASLVGNAVTTLAFGFSTSLTGIVAFRFFGGLLGGNSAVINSIMAEITDDTNQDFAISIYSLAWPLGTVVGPLIGGTLENAATRYPQYFSWAIFVEHPYLPPCIASAGSALFALVLGCTLIEETLPKKRKLVHHTLLQAPLPSASHTDTDLNETRPARAMELLSIPSIRALTMSGFALGFSGSAFSAVFTLFCYTPVDAGGLELQPSTIGSTLAFAGMIAVLLRLSAMPYVLRHFDYAKTYYVCMCLWPFTFGILPFISILVRAHQSSSPMAVSPPMPYVFIWTVIFGLLTLSKIAEWSYSLNLLLVKQHAPSPYLLGRSNGVVWFALCIGRAVAPLTVSALFTGVNGMAWAKQWGAGWLWAAPMVVGTIGAARATRDLKFYSRRP